MSDRIIAQDTTFAVATFRLTSDGKDVTNTYAIVSFVIDRVVNRIPTARLIMKDGSTAEETFAASDGNDFTPGKTIEIAAGFDGNNRPLFKGLILKQTIKVTTDGNSRLILDCRDAAAKLAIGRHSRYFTDRKDSEVIATLISSYSGVSAQVEATRITQPEIVQYYSTDWDFILSRAEMNGQIVLVENGQIKVKPPTTSGNAQITLTYGANLIELEAAMDARDQYATVKASAWSYAEQALVEATASEPSVNNQGNLSGKKLAAVIGLSEWSLRHSGEVTQPELKAWADAQLLKSRLAKIQGRVKIAAYPGAKPDALIELSGTGARFNGLAYVSGVRHDFSAGVWQTHLQLGLTPEWFYQQAQDVVEKSASGLLPGVNGLQIGVVVQLQDDPKAEHRILVKAPLVDNRAGGIWARIATLDAGHTRGSFFRPEIGDEVVLGFLNDDPRDAIVLGMLNSSAKPAPLSAADENHQKGFTTRSALKLMFDDEKKIITLETPGGNKLTISDEAKGISLEDQNGNKLTLNDSGIALSSPKDITLEATGKLTLKASQDLSLEGLNVKANANAKFEAKGNAGAEVSTSAIAILKGSLVQIN